MILTFLLPWSDIEGWYILELFKISNILVVYVWQWVSYVNFSASLWSTVLSAVGGIKQASNKLNEGKSNNLSILIVISSNQSLLYIEHNRFKI